MEPTYVDVEPEDEDQDPRYEHIEGTTVHIPGNQMLHEDSEYCWCEPTVYRFVDGEIEIEHNFCEQ